MLLQVWVRERRKNTRARSLARLAGLGLRAKGTRCAREWSAKIRSNPCRNAAYGSHARNFGTRNRLGFWDTKTLAVPSYKYARVPARKEHNKRRTTHLDLPAAPPRTLLHLVRRRAPAIGRAGLRNLVLSDPAPGEGE
jgi:hypothetical protein